MKLLRLCLLASLLVSCSSPIKAQGFIIRGSHLSPKVTNTEILVALEDSINFLPFSFKNLEQKGWDIVERINEEPVIIFQKKDADSTCLITAYVKRIPEGSLRSLQDIEVADDFRKWETENMISEGVSTGLYNLENLQSGEENVGNKRFFTMKYKNVILAEPITIDNSLYLFFPKNNNNKLFWVALFSEVNQGNSDTSEICKNDFLELLSSLKYSP